MHFTDTHTHLYASEFDSDRESLIRHAMDEGVTKFYMPNIDRLSVDKMMDVQKKFPDNCLSMLGLHPCSVNAEFQEELKHLYALFSQHSFSAVGEIGIDLYWDKTFFEQQQEALRIQCKWAVDLNLPIVIHTRSSFEETLSVLHALPTLPRGIFHCFSGTLAQAKQVIEMGFYIGIGGVLTFKNSGLDKIVELIDLKHIVLETDAPYLAPVPFRGKRNEPRYLKIIAEKLADIKNCSVDHIAEMTTLNAQTIFHS